MRMYQVIETYRGIEITQDNEGEFHTAHTFDSYKSVQEVKQAIDEILAGMEAREVYLKDWSYKQVFDEQRGVCLDINGEHHPIDIIRNVPAEHSYLEGAEYIKVDNTRGSKYVEHELFKKLFTGRVKDAVEAVRAGEGDFISASHLLFSTESVVRLIDRKLGERARAEFIKGFKDTEFITGLRANIHKGWGYSYDLGENDELINGKWMEHRNPKAFANEDEAHEYAVALTERVKAKAAEITEDELLKMIRKDNFPESMFEELVYQQYTNDHLDDKREKVSEVFSFEIIQTVKR